MKYRAVWFVSCSIVAGVLLSGCGADEVPSDAAAEEEVTSEDNEASTSDEPATDPAGLYAELAELPAEERLATLEEKAREEGAVLLYGSSNVEMQEAWAEGFQELYPEINILYVRAKSEDLGPRIQAEARAERHLADVIQTSTEVAMALREEGLLVEHHGVSVPDGMPEDYVEPWFVMNQVNPNLIVWNTELVPEDEAPTSLDDLLDPKWKGKVAIDVGPQAFVQGLIADRGLGGAEAYLQALVVENEALVRSGHTSMTNLLAAGEFPVAVELYADKVESLIVDEDAPLAWLAPEPTAGHGVGVAIYAYTQHPHAAALLMRYILAPDGGGQIMADTGRLATHPDVEMPYPRLQEFLVEGSDLNGRLLTMTPRRLAEVGGAFELIDEYITPRLSE